MRTSGKLVQSRLDDAAQKALAALVDSTGMSPSEAIRRGLRLLAATHVKRRQRRIAGQGQFASGIADLGSNKKHLQGFGK